MLSACIAGMYIWVIGKRITKKHNERNTEMEHELHEYTNVTNKSRYCIKELSFKII